MYWKITCEDVPADAVAPDSADGRFVLHRHTDADGPHLDLRLEHEGYLLGWRIDGPTLGGEPWATEKAPHPPHWLDHEGGAVCEDAGVYAWVERGARNTVLLYGRHRARRISARRETGLIPSAVRAICSALAEAGAGAADAARLIRDGLHARHRAVERFCGLGKELDGNAFDDPVWRKTLAALTLDEIHAQLRAYEVRFDKTYPPQPVSQPEPLPAWDHTPRSSQAMAILRD